MFLAPQKEIAVKDIKSRLTPNTAWLAWDFSHLDNETIFKLKKELAQVPAQFKVYKNNLIRKALWDYSLTLQQPTALIFGSAQSLPKILNLLNQFQPPRSPIKRFKVGWGGNKIITVSQLEKWATLPNREVLMSNLCFNLQWPLRRLVDVLGKIKKDENI